MSVKFKKGTTEVELPDPSPGSKARLVKHQALGLTSSGKRLAYDKGVERYELAVQFESLDDDEKEALVYFFGSTTDGVAEEFTYVDAAGNIYDARFISPGLEFSRAANGVWDVTVALELSEMAR